MTKHAVGQRGKAPASYQHQLYIFHNKMDEVHSDAESVSSVSVKDAPVVPANNKRKARSPPEDPVTPEAKVLLDRVKRLKVDLDDLRKKDRFDVIQSMPGR